jgi:hypothetical protein
MKQFHGRSSTMRSSRIPTALAATALVVALFAATPISHAAGRLVLGKNTVGTAQLKKNAVTAAKVRNGSLLAADFRAGQLPAGPQGDPGPIGPSDAFVAGSADYVAMPGNTWTTVKSITLPAGNYVLFARAEFASSSNGTVQCLFNPSGTGVFTTPSVIPWGDVGLALSDTVTLSTPATVNLRCYPWTGNSSVTAWRPVITAVKVGSVTVR